MPFHRPKRVAKPGQIQFPPYYIRKILQGTPALLFADGSNIRIPKLHLHGRGREEGKKEILRVKYHRGSTPVMGRNEHVPERPIVKPPQTSRRYPILIPE